MPQMRMSWKQIFCEKLLFILCSNLINSSNYNCPFFLKFGFGLLVLSFTSRTRYSVFSFILPQKVASYGTRLSFPIDCANFLPYRVIGTPWGGPSVFFLKGLLERCLTRKEFFSLEWLKYAVAFIGCCTRAGACSMKKLLWRKVSFVSCSLAYFLSISSMDSSALSSSTSLIENRSLPPLSISQSFGYSS